MNINNVLKKGIIINKKKTSSVYKNRVNIKKIGIMGGTFDPIHYGHLATAEAVRIKYELDKVIFIPSGNPPHKGHKNIIDKFYRYNMTILATMSNTYFEVSSMEIKREGRTYTIDTLKKLKNLYMDSELFFITGADALCDIESWKDVQGNFNLATFIGATRPGVELLKVKNKIDRLKNKYNAKILNIHVPSLDISSTDIRERIKQNESIKYLLPEDVEKYIYKYNLYR
ncbi:nicotinate-nucleotide adenylyltransferase [Tepidibacter formicigenes]|jgi:nicotinate-nucleotide adenylyltransferase|uniref:Probable nicotinate-nucleotide adenylyltransferase n=1 Tax=Tepidibacter formicigenes DSM 15518 TaxID=1123349 RepID=A0A1M6JYC4_9FIRM|nr:nicotinate-nucleotide adenylyltransferase [Tepidibacter formicigenes]SHJ51709.1 nicotinate-nucleotide adenylyltransferase [Tepidibacter formicigenes DSM 15518]